MRRLAGTRCIVGIADWANAFGDATVARARCGPNRLVPVVNLD
jgi:hypothetical protein